MQQEGIGAQDFLACSLFPGQAFQHLQPAAQRLIEPLLLGSHDLLHERARPLQFGVRGRHRLDNRVR